MSKKDFQKELFITLWKEISMLVKRYNKLIKPHNSKPTDQVMPQFLKDNHFKPIDLHLPYKAETIRFSHKEAAKDVQLINYYRKQFNKKPLREAEDLDAIAQYHAEHEEHANNSYINTKTGNLWADDDAYKLGLPKLSSYDAYGENIVADASMAMRHKTSRVNILFPYFTQVGTGFWNGVMIEYFTS